jgi:DNA replication initiation complex subunit (GINS family)
MKTTTIHVRRETHAIIRDLAKIYGLSMGKVIEKAVEDYKREKLLEKANEAYTALEANPEA